MGDVRQDIRKMAVEVELKDFGGIYDWQFAIIETYADYSKEFNPYDKLLIAVLTDAIARVLKPVKLNHSKESHRHRRARESAIRWIKSNRDDYVLDFVNICEHFGWSPDRIRIGIAELMEKTKPVIHPKKPPAR